MTIITCGILGWVLISGMRTPAEVPTSLRFTWASVGVLPLIFGALVCFTSIDRVYFGIHYWSCFSADSSDLAISRATLNVRAFPKLKKSLRTRSELIPSTRKSPRKRSLCSTGYLASFTRILSFAINSSRESTLWKGVKLPCCYQLIWVWFHEVFKSFPVVVQVFLLVCR